MFSRHQQDTPKCQNSSKSVNLFGVYLLAFAFFSTIGVLEATIILSTQPSENSCPKSFHKKQTTMNTNFFYKKALTLRITLNAQGEDALQVINPSLARNKLIKIKKTTDSISSALSRRYSDLVTSYAHYKVILRV